MRLVAVRVVLDEHRAVRHFVACDDKAHSCGTVLSVSDGFTVLPMPY
jgi:hypothetical protein